jgi:tetratricopeptide (TPR) repeat protein
MESVTRGLRTLQADAAWFARAQELRLLHVSTSADLGANALKLCLGQELHADNHSLYFGLEEPYSRTNDGWYSRGQSLRKQYAAKQEGLAKAGISLRPLAPAVKRSPAILEFTELLQDVLAALAPPISGVVVVLAPKQVEPGSPFIDDLRQLIASRALTSVRWIVIERDVISSRSLVDELAPRALASEWWRDENAAKLDLAALVGPLNPSLDFTPKYPTWQAAGAAPDVEPPPRVDAPTPPTDEQITAAGLAPIFVKGGGQALQKLLLGGALAIKDGRHAEAIQLQQAAMSLCGAMGMLKAKLINTLILGSYFMAAQSPKEARKTYEQAEAQAQQQQLTDEEAQANLALGMLDAVEGKSQQSMARYLKAGDVAEASGNHALAIESWRTAGQLAFNLKANDAAIQPWLRATNLAATMDPTEVKATSAAECARGVATILRSRGQLTEATAFDQNAFRFEHGLPQSAPVPQS